MAYSDVDRDLQGKLGQLLYNMVLTENLVEYFLERVRRRGSFSTRIPLGKDGLGHEYVIDVLIHDISKKIAVPEGEPEPEERVETKDSVSAV